MGRMTSKVESRLYVMVIGEDASAKKVAVRVVVAGGGSPLGCLRSFELVARGRSHQKRVQPIYHVNW